MHFKISLSCLVVLLSCIITWTAGQDAGDTASATSAATTTAPKTSPKNEPETVAHFIRAVMKKYGEAKAAEALQSLDQLPLGLTMKILLVEVDKPLATDIVAMQRYAQGSDKTLITMIGRIVAGDKTVPKEIFLMDQKLMKFPWWLRIRARMFSNLEKYVAAYSLVPVAAKAAVNGAKTKGSDIPAVVGDETKSELAAAVAASATEAPKQEQVAVASSTASQSVEPPQQLKLSLLTPIQQQQILETLALAKSVQATNANPAIQTQSQTNPFLLFG
ncbi:hypothetical protein Ocin01_09412 [Orchesella cincta]|uniref:Uncharacterized protein n=1 Tax=Orchesella cincta TaxID=48709 RepID=A0A1D2MW32_ORCCI|nr:hypothetical protein Ocin01_09412 [Orchesella cincta]